MTYMCPRCWSGIQVAEPWEDPLGPPIQRTCDCRPMPVDDMDPTLQSLQSRVRDLEKYVEILMGLVRRPPPWVEMPVMGEGIQVHPKVLEAVLARAEQNCGLLGPRRYEFCLYCGEATAYPVPPDSPEQGAATPKAGPCQNCDRFAKRHPHVFSWVSKILRMAYAAGVPLPLPEPGPDAAEDDEAAGRNLILKIEGS